MNEERFNERLRSNIYYLTIFQGFSYSELARRSGVSRSTISRVLREGITAGTTVLTLERIASGLGTNLSTLYRLDIKGYIKEGLEKHKYTEISA